MKELYEFVDYIKDPSKKLHVWLQNFIKNCCNPTKRDMRNILTDFDDVFMKVKDTYFAWVFSETAWNTSEWMQESYKKFAPEQSGIVFLAEKFHIDPNRLIEEYTPEMIHYYSEWLLRNLNEQTKEGKAKNKVKANKKKIESMPKDEKEKLEKFFKS